MDFPRLKSSTALNCAEEPSIYLTLCMVEALFKDVEEAAGRDLSKIPVGDETVPTKLIWLCRQLLKIYKGNGDLFSRNRARLDEMMQQLLSGEAMLAESIRITDELQALQERKAALQDDLTHAQKARERHRALKQEVKALEQELTILSGFDFAGAQTQIDELNARRDALRQKRQEAETQLSLLRKEASALSAQLEEKSASVKALQESSGQAKEQLAQIEKELAQCRQSLHEQQQVYQALTAEKEKYIAQIACQGELEQRTRQQIEEFQTKKLLPAKEAVDNAKRELDACRQDYSGHQALMEDYEKERDAVILRIAVLTPEVEKAKRASEEKRAEFQAMQDAYDAARQENDALLQEIRDCTRQLGQTQDSLRQLRTETCPSVHGQLDAALISLRQKQDEVANYEAQISDLEVKCADLQRDIPPLAEKLREKNAEYTELTARYTEQNMELSRLQQQLEAMRGKNDREKLRRYKEQLNTDISELSALSKQCEETDANLTAIQQQIEGHKQKLKSLQEQKNTLQELEQNYRAQIDVLSSAATQENLQRIDELRARLGKMHSAGKALSKAQALMVQVLDTPSLQAAPDLSRQLEATSSALDVLQKALLTCADSIHLEARE